MNRRVRQGVEVTVSVVMPFFNHGMFVDEAVASVRAQSRPVDEIVIVDDGSTDSQSKEALALLEADGIVVVRQSNQGPSAARNAGVTRSSGDAVLFLDSDDLLSERQVEVALRTLAAAPPEVGFAYPDMQFFGNERDLVVMPPYNFYLLLHRNFCGMGSLIDRSVFDAGAQFRADLLRGHEDWDFFINLGKIGVHGQVFHGEPLLWRRWGYSRSDSVQEERGSFLGEIRVLHPDLYDSRRLIELKRVWAPALSVVAPARSDLVTVQQTCDDFEVVISQDGAPLPEVRGRWVALLGESGLDALTDPTFVERSLRLLCDRPNPVALGLRNAGRAPAAWARSEEKGTGGSAGVLVDGDVFDDWRRSASPRGRRGVDAFLAHLSPLGEPREWWAIGASGRDRPGVWDGHPARGTARPALPPPASPRPAREDNRHGAASEHPAMWSAELNQEGIRIEIGFRRFEAMPLFIPAGGFSRLPTPPKGYRDGLEAVTQRAWSRWSPSRTRRLDLVVDLHGRAFLETVDDEEELTLPSGAGGTARRAIGRVWVRPFPGTACLYSNVDVRTHTYSYRVSNEPPRNAYELPVGYVAIERLEGMVDLRRAINETSRSTFAGRRVVMIPPVEVELVGAFVEQFTSSSGPAWRGRANPTPSSDGIPFARRWPLYELFTKAGSYRYTRSPDACVGREDLLRPAAQVVVELAEPVEGGALLTLHEVQFRETGGPGYVSGPELAAGLDHLDPVRALGDIAEQPGVNTPMVRLHPGSPSMAPPGEPGHRLAIDWKPLTAGGYVAEGVVGFAWEPDPSRAPLYRWRRATGDARRLTLGERPEGFDGDWVLEGTLGAAWRVGTRQAGLVDLWELERDGTVAYSTAPDEWEVDGFSSRRIVARIFGAPGPGLLPLFELSTGAGGRPLVTTSPDEWDQAADGRQSILGYLEVAVPPPGGAQSVKAPVPGWAVPVDEPGDSGRPLQGLLLRAGSVGTVPVTRNANDGRVRVGEQGSDAELVGHALAGLAPYAIPVYALRRTADGATALSTTPPAGGEWEIAGVRCFLASVDSADPGAPASALGHQKRSSGTAKVGARVRRKVARAAGAAASLPVVSKSELGRVLPESVRRRLRDWGD